MAWYYVKGGGTATGDGGRVTTQRTGLWNSTASEYYDTLEDVVGATTVPTDGDTIVVSDVSSNSYTPAGDITLNSTGSAAGAGLMIVSADDANQENYKPGASETMSGAGNNIIIDNNVLFAGIDITVSDGIVMAITARYFRCLDLTIASIGTNSALDMRGDDGLLVDLINVDLDRTSNTSNFGVNSGAMLRWRGGTLLGTATNLVGVFSSYTEGGGTVLCEGIDFSVLTGELVGVLGADTADVVALKFINCLLNSSITLPFDTSLKLPQQRFEMWGCDDSTGDDLFRYHMQDGSGKVVNNEAKFVTADKAWYEGSAKSSYELSTRSKCSANLPFIFDLPIEYIDFSASGSDVIRVLITSSIVLTDVEIIAYLMYQDGTIQVQANWVTSGPTVGSGNYGVDPIGAGSTLATSTVAWTGALSNKYHLVLDTTGDVGDPTPAFVRIEVRKASITAGQVYIALETEKV